MDAAKIQRHIDHLQQQHHDIDEQLKEQHNNYGNDNTILELKKKKLHLKDEIERLKTAVA